jgi:hypothetical protein
MLADAMRGDDPVEVRRTARRAPSVANLAADYLERYAVPKKRPKSVAIIARCSIVLPELGAKRVEFIGGREIEAIHVAMKDRSYQANRVLSLV